jgi:hypothetical protein
MRAAAYILILAMAATILACAQCAVACVQPAPPRCHHSPQKAAKTCDPGVVFEEKRQLIVAEIPMGAPSCNAPPCELSTPSFAALDLAFDAPVRPPGGVLRI